MSFSASNRATSALADLNDNDQEDSSRNLNRYHASQRELELQEALRIAQLQLDKLKEQCRTLEEENRVLKANKLRKSAKSAVSDAVSPFDGEIQMMAKKFGIMAEMFFPADDLLMRHDLSPTPIPSFNTPARYLTQLTAEAGLISELNSLLPDHLRDLRKTNHFSNIFELALGEIFELPSKYFSSKFEGRGKVPKICSLLGVDPEHTNTQYKAWAPVFFADKKVDPQKPFSNWKPIAQILKAVLWGKTSLALEGNHMKRAGPKTNGAKWAINVISAGSLSWAATVILFLLSPDVEFAKNGRGEKSGILYSRTFLEFKRFTIMQWESPHMRQSSMMSYEDLTAEMDAAMAAMNMTPADEPLEPESAEEPVVDGQRWGVGDSDIPEPEPDTSRSSSPSISSHRPPAAMTSDDLDIAGVQAAADDTNTVSRGRGPGRGKRGAMGQRGAAASGASNVIPTNTRSRRNGK
ncbi:hypothetical protein BDN67DRAFT_1017037 [Paxillus ammoniavirescens]|nr:hypothetical protein BDN67DRAFT_1017037 [Paxillus ammoniavirescens]